MTKLNNISNKWKKIPFIILAMMSLSVVSFNCSPSLFQAAKGGGIEGVMDFFSVFDKPNAPYSLMTAEQTYQSMLNVTGQTAVPVAAAEYTLRFATLASTDSLAKLNSPLMMASTSLAGDVCNNLLTAERAATERRFFTGVNFNAGLDAGSEAAYSASVQALAGAFWGRAINTDETALFSRFYTEFRTGETNNANLTSDLYLSVCSAMLSSFDSLVY